MSGHVQDLALARRAAAGDAEALETIWATHVGRLYRFVLHQVGECHWDAQDVLQETLIAALESLETYRGESSLYSWLCGVAWHKAADLRRGAFWRRTFERRAMAAWRREGRTEPDGEQGMLIEEQRARVRRALARLPEHYQRVLRLKYGEELPVEEIEQRTGRTFKSIESLLTRARAALRAAYEEVV